MLFSNNRLIIILLTLAVVVLLPLEVMAHGVDEKTRLFLQNNTGVQFFPFMYIGAKHMVTGYDHLLLLVYPLCIKVLITWAVLSER